jgi:predicted permease
MKHAWWQFGRREDDLSEEIESHIAMAIAERVARGESIDSATAAARRQFGNREQIRATARDMWGWVWLEQLMLDFRYAARKLRQAPGFAAVASLSLAIGIGATVTMYAVIDAADIRGLPYPQADRLYVLQQTAMIRPRADGPYIANASAAPAATTSVWIATTHAFDSMSRVGLGQLLWPHDDESEVLPVAVVGAGFFPLLGATPMIGRGIVAADTSADAPGVIVLSHTFWHDRFSADRHVIGQQVTLDTSDTPGSHKTYTVIGVMPGQIDYPPAVSGWIAERQGSQGWATILAHLGDGKSVSAAVAELQGATQTLPAPPGSAQPPGVRATGLRESLQVNGPDGMFSIDSAEGRMVRFGVVFFVLVIAMFNVGNLLLARSAARDQEMTVRRALGASRGRLAQQLLVEGSCIALIGGVLGIAVAQWGIATSGAFGSLATRGIVPVLDWRVLAFALALTVIVALGTGFIPVLALGRAAGGSDGSESPRASAGRARTRVQSALLVVQIAAALTLLTGAGILGKELLRLQKQGFGIDATNITFFQNVHRPYATSSMTGAQFRDEVVRRLGLIPGVSSVSSMDVAINDGFFPAGQPAKAGRTIFDHQDVAVNPGFIRNLGIPLLRGRDFSDADFAGAAPVALVSKAAAESFWPGEDPIGKEVVEPPPRKRPGDTTSVDPTTLTVVGVVGNLRLGRVLGPPPMTLLRPNGVKAGITNYFVRTTKDPEVSLPAIRRELRALQQIPMSRMMYGNLQEQGINRQLSEQRVTTRVLVAFAAVALLLATLGIHGLVAYAVSQRTREIGVRMALGAEASSVLLLVTQRGLRLAAIGIVFGVAGAYALSQTIRSMLFGTSPTDPVVFVGSALLLATVVIVASYLPARRATRVDPMIALRVD